MVRSLWTAASGMIAQQNNVDTISNNLANISTVGYKKETAEFKSLLYQNTQQTMTDKNGDPKPVSAQVGLGVRNSAIASSFTQGILTASDGEMDMAIEGDGFFRVRTADGTIGYTRNGAFNVSLIDDGYTIATDEGYPLLDVNGNPIVLSEEYSVSNLNIDESGNLTYKGTDGIYRNLGIQIGLVQFTNPVGLMKSSDSILLQSNASGEPILEVGNNGVTKSRILKGYLEGSNVQAVDEMVNLIVAQRAYEMNSKIITASDEMMQQANNLR